MRGDKGMSGQSVRRQRTAGIEAEPAEPEQASAENGHGQIVGSHRSLAEADASAERMGAGEGRRRRGHVDDRTSGKVNRAKTGHPAAAPDPVSHGAIGEGHPQRREQQHGRKTDALRIGSGNERYGKSREHALKNHEYGVRQIGCRAVGFFSYAEKKYMIEAAYKSGDVSAKSQRIAEYRPKHRNEAKRRIAVHAGGQDVARANEAAVKKRQRRSHKHDEPCTEDDESCV